jgi:hypothetical protein
MTDETVEFSATQREAGDGAPGATAAFPYDRMSVERFREAFPRARWRDDLMVRTPYSRTVIAELRAVPWARWDPVSKAWRVPFRSFEELRRRWPAIEDAARHAEPEERRKRAESRKASPEHEDRCAEAAECRRHRYPVPEDASPPLNRVLMTHAGPVVFEVVTGELVEPMIAARPYPGVTTGSAALIWAGWRRPSHAELVQTWPARTTPGPADLARGWWQPTIEVLWEERRRTASLERAQVTRRAKAL